MLDQQSGHLNAGRAGSGRGFRKQYVGGVGEPGKVPDLPAPLDGGGGASRFFYCAKASSRERNQGLNGDRNSHPTVKPISLMRWLCRLVCPPGGLILDPFAGSGSTLIAAHLEGFQAQGIEQDEGYCRIAEARIAHWTRQPRQEALILGAGGVG